VSKYVKDHGVNRDLFDSHKDYRERFNELEDESRYVLDTSKVHRELNRTVAFDLDELYKELDDFDTNTFFD